MPTKQRLLFHVCSTIWLHSQTWRPEPLVIPDSETSNSPSGRWRARYRPPYRNADGTIREPLEFDKSHWVNVLGPGKTFPNKSKARAALDRVDYEIATGLWKHPDDLEREAEIQRLADEEAKREALEEAFTSGQWVTQWLEDLEHGDYSANSLRTYYSGIKPFLESFEDIPLRRITVDDLNKWLRNLKSYTRKRKDGTSTKRTRSTDTINKLRRVTSICLTAAVELGRLEVNPMPKATKRTRESKGVAKPLDYRPTDAEVMETVNYAAPPIAAAITLAYKAGLRSGEIRALRREHLVLTGDFPHVKTHRLRSMAYALHFHADYGTASRIGYGDKIHPSNDGLAARLGYADWSNEYRTTIPIALIEALQGNFGAEYPPSSLVESFIAEATKHVCNVKDSGARQATEPARQI